MIDREGDLLSLVYSYRLTSFSGAAPCMDHDYLTLAICKRDMRRVIGRQFLAGTNDTIWFIGIVGSELSNYEPFHNRAGEFFYIAKLTDVKTFMDYFADTKDNRMDKIYLPDKNGMYGKTVRFSPKAENGIHERKKLWDEDWDIQHGSEETYVLCSDCFCVLTSEQSKKLRSLSPDHACYPEKQGHRCFSVEDNSPFIAALQSFTDPEKNTKLYQQNENNGSLPSCGKVKAV